MGRVFHQLAPPVAAALAHQSGLIERLRWQDTDLGLMLTRMYSFGSSATDQASRFVASMVSATPIDVVAEFLPALQEHDKRSALPALERGELLVIVGEDDRLMPKEQSDEIVPVLPGAEYVVIPDSGHMVTLEKPAEWSGSVCREWHTGHFHSQAAEWQRPIETIDSVIVRICPSLSAADQWHSENGFLGSRQAMETFLCRPEGGLASMHISEPP